MKFEIHLSSRSYKFLKRVDKRTYDRLVRKLVTLAEDPFQLDVKKVMGRKRKTLSGTGGQLQNFV